MWKRIAGGGGGGGKGAKSRDLSPASIGGDDTSSHPETTSSNNSNNNTDFTMSNAPSPSAANKQKTHFTFDGQGPPTPVDAEFLGQETEMSMLQAITADIQYFSESMNILLSKMAGADPPEKKKAAVLVTLQTVEAQIVRVIEQTELDWSSDVIPCYNELLSLVSGWDTSGSHAPCPDGFAEAADDLLRTFTRKITDFLKGADDDLFMSQNSFLDEPSSPPPRISTVHQTLWERENGLGAIFQASKNWSRFAKEMIVYYERKAAIELEYHKKLGALAKTTMDNLVEFRHNACYESFNHSLAQRYRLSGRFSILFSGPNQFGIMQPLTDARTEHERLRKEQKDLWAREYKRFQEHHLAMQKAKAKYQQLCIDWEKSLLTKQKEEQSKYKLKLEKRSKEETDIRTKLEESRKVYFQSVVMVNGTLSDVLSLKDTILSVLAKSLFDCGESMLGVLHAASQTDLQVAAPMAEETSLLVTEVENDDTAMTIFKLLTDPDLPGDLFPLPAQFNFEPYTIESATVGYLNDLHESNPCIIETSSSTTPSQSDMLVSTSDPAKRRMTALDVAAQPDMHAFMKYSRPGMCRHCKHPCFQSVQCLKCGIVVHSKCTEYLTMGCPGTMPRPTSASSSFPTRRPSTFGRPLADQAEGEFGVPAAISFLIERIEQHGMTQEGIYRISSIKSQIERVRAALDVSPAAVAPDDQTNVHVLTAVLKMYLRQLPDPVIPRSFLPQFLKVASDMSLRGLSDESRGTAASETRVLVDQLPPVNYNTLAYLVCHLRRVASHCEENKMNAANLAIIFGPTLLKLTPDDVTNFLDMPEQTQIILLMVNYCDLIFHSFIEAHDIVVPVIIRDIAANVSRKSAMLAPGFGSPLALSVRPHHARLHSTDSDVISISSPILLQGGDDEEDNNSSKGSRPSDLGIGLRGPPPDPSVDSTSDAHSTAPPPQAPPRSPRPARLKLSGNQDSPTENKRVSRTQRNAQASSFYGDFYSSEEENFDSTSSDTEHAPSESSTPILPHGPLDSTLPGVVNNDEDSKLSSSSKLSQTQFARGLSDTALPEPPIPILIRHPTESSFGFSNDSSSPEKPPPLPDPPQVGLDELDDVGITPVYLGTSNDEENEYEVVLRDGLDEPQYEETELV